MSADEPTAPVDDMKAKFREALEAKRTFRRKTG